MANFAVISGSKVSNVIVASSKKNAELATNFECVEYTDENPAGIGWSYIDKVFIAPIPIEVIDETIPE
jgi:hypothetical protein